jgi:hypothetical protein
MSTEVKAPAWHVALSGQVGAALDMFANAIHACPPEVWDDTSRPVARRFWYLAYHSLFWLDRYWEEVEANHKPPAPFTMGELDPAGVYPDTVYSKEQLLTYLEYGRAKVRQKLEMLDEARAAARCGFPTQPISQLELYHHSLRHTAPPPAPLLPVRRLGGGAPPRWVLRGTP